MSETQTQPAQTIPEQTPYKEALEPGEAMEEVRQKLAEGLPESDQGLRIAKLLEKRGPESLEGFGFKVNLTEGSYSFATPEGVAGTKKYVIRQAGNLKGDKLQPEHTVLPSSQKTLEDRIPFIYTRGGVFHFGRRIEEKRVPTDVPSYVIDKYNDDGKLEDILVYSQKKLLNFMDSAAITKVITPDEKGEEAGTAHGTRNVEIDTSNRGKETFTNITEQLEARNVYDWTGLGWQETKERKATDEEKRKYLEGQGLTADGMAIAGTELPAVTDTRFVEIVRQATLNENFGGETMPVRAFVIKETTYGEITSEKLRVIKGAAIRPYLEEHRKNKKNRAVIKGMHLVQPEVSAPALEANIDEKRVHLETFIHSQMSEVSGKDDDEKLALWLLSYSDIKDPEGEGSRQERRARLHDVERAPEGDTRIKAVKELISIHGVAKVYALARKLRDEFVSAADSLNLPTEFTDVRETKETAARSISWVLEDLADIYRFAKNPDKTDAEHKGLELSDPFDKTIAAGRQQRNIVARQLAASLMSEAVHRDIVAKPKLKDDKVVHEPNEVFIFNPESLRHVPSLTKDAIIADVEEIYPYVENKQTILWTDLVKLGNELQRSIGK